MGSPSTRRPANGAIPPPRSSRARRAGCCALSRRWIRRPRRSRRWPTPTSSSSGRSPLASSRVRSARRSNYRRSQQPHRARRRSNRQRSQGCSIPPASGSWSPGPALPKAPAPCPLGAQEHRLGDFLCSLFFRSLAKLVAPIRQRVQRLPMSFVKWLFIVAAAGYLAIGALMFFAQRALMYFPDRQRTPPAAGGLPQADEIMLDTADGERVLAWHVPPRGDKPVVLYFHGNGGSLRLRVDRFQKLVADGTGLLALSYRGYGGSSGKPTEAGLIEDGRAAYAFAAERYAGRTVLWGESLGTAVAIALAAEKPVTRLILDAPFTSALDVAAGPLLVLAGSAADERPIPL